jgi:hypothetical protein
MTSPSARLVNRERSDSGVSLPYSDKASVVSNTNATVAIKGSTAGGQVTPSGQTTPSGQNTPPGQVTPSSQGSGTPASPSPSSAESLPSGIQHSAGAVTPSAKPFETPPPTPLDTSSRLSKDTSETIPGLYEKFYGDAASICKEHPTVTDALVKKYKEVADKKRREADDLEKKSEAQRGPPRFYEPPEKDPKEDLSSLLTPSEDGKSERSSGSANDSTVSSDAASTSSKATDSGRGLRKITRRFRKVANLLLGNPVPESSQEAKSVTVDAPSSPTTDTTTQVRQTQSDKKPRASLLTKFFVWLVSHGGYKRI